MSGHCQFDHQTPDGLWQCAQCGYVYKIPADKPPIRSCRNAPDLTPIAERLAEETGDPTIVEKIGHYTVALARWSMSGFPTRSKDEVARIYAECCLPCKQFDSLSDACKLCGCPVRVEGMALGNKIAMGTEECRLGKW